MIIEKSISFNNRYFLILFDALYSYYIYNTFFIRYAINYNGYFIYALFCTISSLVLFLCSRNIKTRIGLGIFYKLTPFEKAYNYSNTDLRIKRNIKFLKGISNREFYEKFYRKVKNNEDVKIKNAEYCFFRDCAVLTFMKVLVLIMLYFIVSSQTAYLFIATLILYIVLVCISWRTAKDFVLQILVSEKE